MLLTKHNWATWRGYSYLCATIIMALSLAHNALSLIAAAIIWLTAISGAGHLKGRSRNQTLLLLGLGFAGLDYSLLQGASMPWLKLLQSNAVLLSMLFAVSFLSLVATPTASSKERKLPTGKTGLISTLLANHLFGAVINISSVVMIGERLKAYRDIDLPLARSLAITFGLCALWSPFFASMAYTMVLVPDMNLYSVMLMGIPISAIGIAILYWQNRKTSDGLPGYPLKGRSLVLPSLLALVVIICHEIWPTTPIPMIIVIASLVLVIGILLLEKRAHLVHKHCQNRLGNYIAEASIFLAAGVFSTGLGQLLQVTSFELPFSQYGATEAGIVLFCSLIIARLGVHAIIIIALLNPLLNTLDPPANLLAMTYLSIWGVGMAINPLSGTVLTIQGQFGITGSAIARSNTGYTITLFVIFCGAFYLYGF